MMLVKADLLFVALPLVCLDSAGVWLSSQAIIWISVLAGLFRVFANQVTYDGGITKELHDFTNAHACMRGILHHDHACAYTLIHYAVAIKA